MKYVLALSVLSIATLGCAAEASGPSDPLVGELAAELDGHPADLLWGDDGAAGDDCEGIDRSSGVPHWEGLSGTYVPSPSSRYRYPRPELMQLRILTEHSAPGNTARFGTYDRLDNSYRYQRGGYGASPDNPAIGPAIGFYADESREELLDVYFVLAIERSEATGRIARMCLGKGDGDPDRRPFVLERWGF